MKIKFFNNVFVGIVLLSSVILVSCTNNSNQKRLNVYNWGDYMDERIIAMFEEETGISVNYEVFATNEDMYTKIKNGGSSYDIAIPSDYMIEKMINEDMLEKINFDNIPNYKNIGETFKSLSYDQNNEYSVPYTWGTLGILYNTTMVDEEVNSFNILWDTKYSNKIFMYDSLRDSLGVSLKRLGFSLNTLNLDELEQATLELIAQKPLVQAYIGDPVKDKMIGNEGALAIVYSGDAMYILEENSNLKYVVPNEGSNLWFDSIVIPKGAKNIKEAEMFIDFLSRPQIALMNTIYTGYSTANMEAFKLLPEELQNNEVYWPSQEIIQKCEIFKDLGEVIREYDLAWTRVMIS